MITILTAMISQESKETSRDFHSFISSPAFRQLRMGEKMMDHQEEIQEDRIDPSQEVKLMAHRHKHRSNSISNGQIHILAVPKIKVSLVPEAKNSPKNSSKTSSFATIDEESDPHHHLYGSGLHPNESNNNDYKNHQNLKFIRKRSNSISNGQIGKVTSSSAQFFNEGRRRISQVGSVVSQSLQTTIGWKSIANEQEIANQAKCLCAKYVRFKLRKSGLIHKRLHLQRLRSVGNMSDDSYQNINRVAFELKCIIQELERTHPKVFSSVVSNTGNAALKSVASVTRVHSLIGQFIFSGDITWTHVAAFFSVTGALAVDSVRCGHPEFVLPLIESLSEFIRINIASWISQEGGWESLVNKYRDEDDWMKTLKVTILSFAIVFMGITVFFIMY